MYYANKKLVTFRVTYQQMVNYCFLIIDPTTGDAILIDPAWEIDTIIQALIFHKATLQKIFVTHHHHDHLNLADALSEKFNVPIVLSKQEVECYNIQLNRVETFKQQTFIQAGSIYVQALPTPGHTAGSTCYLIDDMLFTGDTLFNEGCGMCIGKGADPHEMYQSLEKLKRCLPGETRIFPGHKYGTELGQPFSELLRYNLYLCIPTEEKFVQYRMRKLPMNNMLNFK